MSNIQTVQKIYEAFGKGDVAFILDQLADDVNWSTDSVQPVAPWHGEYKGKGEVPKFFEALAATIEVTEFTPTSFAANATEVHTFVRFGMRVPATGKQGTMNLHHLWQFNDAGQVTQYNGGEDTALTAELLSK